MNRRYDFHIFLQKKYETKPFYYVPNSLKSEDIPQVMGDMK